MFGGLGHQLLAGCGVWMCPVVQIPSRHRATDTGKRKEPEQSAACSWKPSMTFLDFWFSVHSVHSFSFLPSCCCSFHICFCARVVSEESFEGHSWIVVDSTPFPKAVQRARCFSYLTVQWKKSQMGRRNRLPEARNYCNTLASDAAMHRLYAAYGLMQLTII